MAVDLSVTPISRLQQIDTVLSNDLLLVSRSLNNDGVHYTKSYKASVIDMARTISAYIKAMQEVQGDLINYICVDIRHVSGDVMLALQQMCNVKGSVYNNLNSLVQDITGPLSTSTNLVQNIGSVSSVTNNITNEIKDVSGNISVVNNTSLSVDELCGAVNNIINTDIKNIRQNIICIETSCDSITLSICNIDESVNSVTNNLNLSVNNITGDINNNIRAQIYSITESITNICGDVSSMNQTIVNNNASHNSVEAVLRQDINNISGDVNTNICVEIASHAQNITNISGDVGVLSQEITNVNNSLIDVSNSIRQDITNMSGDININIKNDIASHAQAITIINGDVGTLNQTVNDNNNARIIIENNLQTSITNIQNVISDLWKETWTFYVEDGEGGVTEVKKTVCAKNKEP